ncbi:hypothetical protein B0O80DRAFT_389719 [Mortierella sp. GBAus27b]|nr:hypothetical protein B0O80DRAFT_389719 [Mortierella sp. GBAus27b]
MALVAVAASVTTTAVILGVQGSQRRQRSKHHRHRDDCTSPLSRSSHTLEDFKQSIHQEQHHHHHHHHHHDGHSRDGAKVPFDEELIQEQLARNIAFLGEEGVQKLRQSFVVIVGAGGVGSWAATMLIKSGVGKIRIVDYDQISLSGLNQHATATRADLGTPKVIAMKKYFRMIAPWAEVDACDERFQEDCAEHLLSGNPDYVVDAIGDLKTKLQLLRYCHENKIPVISAMSAGAKADPSRVQIGDISETFDDPLATVVRRRLKRLDVDHGIDVVYSSEKPYQSRKSDSGRNDHQHHHPGEFYSEGMLPLLVPLPAMFGMSMSTYITCKIAGWAIDPFPIRFRMELYQRLHRELKAREEELASTTPDSSSGAAFPLNRRDIGYVVEEMFKGKSVVSGKLDQIVVCRWRREKHLCLLNAVLLTEEEMKTHMALPADADLEEVYGKKVVDYVESRFREEEQISRL